MRLVVALCVLMLLPVGSAQPQPSLVPEQAHVTIAEGDTGLVIQMAMGAQAPIEPVVEHDGSETPMALAGFVQDRLEVPAIGTYVYAATIPAEPGQTITYRAGHASYGFTDTFEVTMPPGRDDPVRFSSYGDIGYEGVGPDGNALPNAENIWPIQIRDLTIEKDPDLFLLSGDLAYDNSRAGWDRFMRMMEPMQATIPTMAVAGNHEWHDDIPEFGYSRFLEHYVLPEDEQNYIFRSGPVTFIGVNSDTICDGDHYRTSYGHRADPCPTGTPNLAQLEWLEGALQEAQADDTPWTVIFMHHPPYSWGRHGDDTGNQVLWGPLYEEYGVDLVLASHDHLYSRSHPTIQGEPQQTGDTYTQGAGPIYLVLGGGGRSLYDLPDPMAEPRPAWHAMAAHVHHTGIFEAHEESISFEAYNIDGELFDAFSLHAATPESQSTPVGFVLVLAALAAALVLGRGPSRR